MSVVACSLALLALAGATPASEPEHHALIIAVGAYASDRVPGLAGPEQDRRLVKSLLVERAGVPAKNVKQLVHSGATLERIRNAFGRLAERTRPGDLVFIYLAGHGVRYAETGADADEPDRCDEALLPHDFDPARPRETALFDDEMATLLGRLDRRRVVLIADLCHSRTVYRSVDGPPLDVLTPRAFTGPETGCRPVGDSAPPRVPEGHVYISAADDDEMAYEMTVAGKEKHGVLTYALARAVASGARSVRDIVADAKSEISGHCDIPQHPHWVGDRGVGEAAIFVPGGKALHSACGGRDRPLLVYVPDALRSLIAPLVGAQPDVSMVPTPERADVSVVIDGTRGLSLSNRYGFLVARGFAKEDATGLIAKARLDHLLAGQSRMRSDNHVDIDLVPTVGAACPTGSAGLATGSIRIGERFCVRVKSSLGGHLTLLLFSADGTGSILYPVAGAPDRLEPGGAGMAGPFQAAPPQGRELLLAVVSATPLGLAAAGIGKKVGGRWVFPDAPSSRTLVAQLAERLRDTPPKALGVAQHGYVLLP